MKILAKFLTLHFIILFANTEAQEVITCAGSLFQKNDIVLSFTCGEPLSETLQSGSYFLTQGFQQGTGLPNSISDLFFDDHPTLRIYPNPTRDKVTIDLPIGLSSECLLEILDSSGHLIDRQCIKNISQEISLSRLQPSTYFLAILNEKLEVIKLSKIVKY